MKIYKENWFCKHCESGSGFFYARKVNKRIKVYMVCITCHRERKRIYQAEHYAKNKRYYLVRAKKWRSENRNKYNASQRAWYKRTTTNDV